ncbi:MAG: hypothetical protein ABIF87_13420 [Pseudomonadota bacterium]
MLRKRTGLLIAVILLISTSGCAIVHHYGPYMGKVVDKETGEPIEGAAVLAVYHTEFYFIAGPVSYYLDAQETLTDKKGEFEIPSLTSFTFRPLHGFWSRADFTIFKPGYGCYPRHKDSGPVFVKPKGNLPENEYVIVKLPRLKTLEERKDNLPSSPTSVPNDKMKLFLYLRDLERINLGFQPIFMKKRGLKDE